MKAFRTAQDEEDYELEREAAQRRTERIAEHLLSRGWTKDVCPGRWLDPEPRRHRGQASKCTLRRAPIRDIIIVGHYGALRGLNHMAAVDALVTLGDPWPNLGVARDEAFFLGLGDAWESRYEAKARAELEQAHGRLRAVRRTRPGRALHVGALLPSGSAWASNVEVRQIPQGDRRPAGICQCPSSRRLSQNLAEPMKLLSFWDALGELSNGTRQVRRCRRRLPMPCANGRGQLRHELL
jgi:hypothetical protein